MRFSPRVYTRTTINHTQLPDELMATYDLQREGIRQMRSVQTTKDVDGTDRDLPIQNLSHVQHTYEALRLQHAHDGS